MNPFAALRRFCEFWADDRPGLACCQGADQDTLDTEPEAFDCETCLVACAQTALDRSNTEAWQVYQRLQSRFAVDFSLMPDLFRAVVAGWPAEDVADLLERLTLMYDVLQPPAPTAQE